MTRPITNSPRPPGVPPAPRNLASFSMPRILHAPQDQVAVGGHGRLVDLHREGGSRAGEDLPHLTVGAGEDEVEQGETEAAEGPGTVPLRQELVEDGEPPPRTEHPRGLGEAA